VTAPLHSVGYVPKIDSLGPRTGEAYSVHISKILEEESTQVRFLVPGCIPRGNVVLMTGESGAKKSWLAYELGHAVASGTGWLGKTSMPCPDGPLPVMILNYDNPTETLRTRLKKLGFTGQDQCFVHTIGHTRPIVANGPELLKLPAEVTRLKYLLEYRKPALVIFDSFRQGVTEDENDSQKMAALMNVFKSWTAINDTTVLLIHHTQKAEKTGGWKADGRGSGEIVASCDVCLKVTLVNQNEGKIEWTKSRTWNVGRTTVTDFEIVDQFSDGEVNEDLDEEDLKEIKLIEKVVVRAKSPLPFEVEQKAVDRVVAELKKEQKLPFLGVKALKTRIVGGAEGLKDEMTLREALRNARKLGLVKYVQRGEGRGYKLAQTT
jgi:archaellum biogenesis ATPase FlaH